MEGHTRTGIMKDGLECMQCDTDTYQDNLVAYTCTDCPGELSSDMGAMAIDECSCRAGTSRKWDFWFTSIIWYDICNECPVGTYKSTLSNDECTVCPDNTISSVGSVNVLQCVCPHGYSNLQVGLPCIECEAGTYKDETGSVECTMCPYRKSSLPGSVLKSDCKCVEGYYEDNGDCTRCPVGTTSPFGATSKVHCLCMPGWIHGGEGCIPCPPGSYKSTIGNEIECTPC